MKRAIDLLLLLTVAIVAFATTDTRTGVFDPDFKSLRISNAENPLLPPILTLGAGGSFVRLSFDELAEDNRYLRYRLIHCDSDWNPTQISETEFVNGFNIGEIYSYALSQRTLVHYVHYDLTLPNEDIQPLLSGNYLIQVFDDSDPDEVLLQARFMVSEEKVPLSAKISSSTDVDYNSRHQQLEIEADLEGARIADPLNDLRLVIVRNGSLTHTLDKPQRILPGRAVYAHQKELIFPAGNEYRRFESTNVRYPGMGIEEYMLIEPYFHVKLLTDKPRAYDRYIYDEGQAGRFFPNLLFSDDPDIEADYLVTHFQLEMPRLSHGDVYLEGDLTNRRLDADSRMVYNEQLGAYVKTLLLKQGLYNYQYVVSPADKSERNPIEGDYYETDNEYLLLLYQREPGARFERLLSATIIK
ncbi:MAG: DUF5103 domain-containing protein [Muribaculaceae bacterium]|nr:DUF5103 domain-containing protein [Muribaculaceae bacterium]